jgi:hypothetical protein
MAWIALGIVSMILFAVLWTYRRHSELKDVLKSFALVAAPLVLAVGGYVIQKEVAANALSKDYVQIAVQILTPPLPQDPSARSSAIPMRCWALAIFDLYSPFPLTEQQKADLMARGISGGNWVPPGWQPPGWQPQGWLPGDAASQGSACEATSKKS